MFLRFFAARTRHTVVPGDRCTGLPTGVCRLHTPLPKAENGQRRNTLLGAKTQQTLFDPTGSPGATVGTGVRYR